MTSAGYIMDRSASLLNDTAKQLYTYTNQLPYLNTAIQELREELELNNVPITNETEAVISLTAEVDNIGGDGGPALPSGLVDIQGIYQRWQGSDNSWMPIQRYEFLPHYMQGDNQQTTYIPAWAWMGQEIRFISSNTDLDIRIDYIKNKLEDVINENSIISMINVENILAYRNAGLCAEFIGENPTRAASLNTQAASAFQRVLGINTKGRQVITARRRPFMQKWKNLRTGY